MPTVLELKQQAKRNKIKGYNKMKKAELLKALNLPAELPKVKKQKSKYEIMKVGDLRELACDMAIKNFGSMKKSELIKVVKEKEPKRTFKVKSNILKEDETRPAEKALTARRTFKVKSNILKEDETRPAEKASTAIRTFKVKSNILKEDETRPAEKAKLRGIPEVDEDKMKRVLQALSQNKKPPYDETLTRAIINNYGIPAKKLNRFFKNKGFYIFAFDLDNVLREIKVRGVNKSGKTKFMAFKYIKSYD